MKETEILRGLQKAKAKHYAAGTAFVNTKPMNSFAQHAQNHADFVANRPQPVAQTEAAENPTSNPVLNAARRGLVGQALMKHQADIEDAAKYAEGTAFLSGEGTSTSDDIDAKLSHGEAVLPAKTVRAVGATNIARLIEQTNGKPPKGQVQAGGGLHAAAGFIEPTENPLGTPVERAAQNRIVNPTGATPSPAPAATMAPEIAISEAAPVARTGAAGMYDKASSAVSGGLSKAKSFVGVGAAQAAPVVAETSALAPSGVGFSRLAAGAKAAGGLGKAALGSFATPLAAIYSSAQSYKKPTSEYQAETGIENELGARAAGVMGDLGNTLTGGLAGKFGNYLSSGSSATPEPVAPPIASPFKPKAAAPMQGAIENAPAQSQTPTAVETPVALRGSDGGLAAARSAMAATNFQDGDTWGDRADKNHALKVLEAQAGVGARESAAQGNIYGADKQAEVSKYGTDLQYAANKANNLMASYKLNNDMHNTRVQQNGDVFQNLFTDTNAKGEPQKGGANHAAAMDKLVGSIGKFGLDIGDLRPEDINQFKELYDVSKTSDDFNNSVAGKAWHTLLQDRAAKSRDVAAYGATAENPGAFINDTTRGVAGRVPNSRTYQGGEMFGLPDADLITATRAKLNQSRAAN
jgi:hypothetical protein